MSVISALGTKVLQKSVISSSQPLYSAAKNTGLFAALKQHSGLKKTLLPPEMFVSKSTGLNKMERMLSDIQQKINHLEIPLLGLIKEFPNVPKNVLNFVRRIHVADEKTITRNLNMNEIRELLSKKGLVKKLEEMLKYEEKIIKRKKSFKIKGNKKGKIPRFIYHLTSKENYNAIVKSGKINLSSGDIPGVYATELDNLITRWSSTEIPISAVQKRNFLDLLLRHATKGKEKIVCIRIPTAELDRTRLLIRSQNRLFMTNAPHQAFIEATKDVPSEQLMERLISSISSHADNLMHPEFTVHAAAGTPAGKASLFKQRKEAFEYIYTDIIPIEKTQKIGEINTKEISEASKVNREKTIKSLLMELFKGTPEQKAIEFLKV